MVRLKKLGIPGKFGNPSKRLHYLQTGPIYHIVTPRKSTPEPDNPLSVKIYYPVYSDTDITKGEKNDKEMLDRIDTYNKDIIRLASGLKSKIEISSDYLSTKNPDFGKNPILKNIAQKHGTASELASYFQKRRFLALKVLLSLVVLAFLFLHINTEFLHKPLVLLLYPVTMGVGAVWFFVAGRKKYEYKHEDYRALSEAYRVQYYLKASGREDNVSDHYLKRHRGELEWVLYALRTSQINDRKHYATLSATGKENPIKRIIFLKTCWIDDQLKYFRKTAIKHNRSAKKWESRANRSFMIAIISACLLSVVSLYAEYLPENLKSFEEIVRAILSCSTSVFLVLAAALHGYSDKMIFAEQAKNYEIMAQLFQLASEKLGHAIEVNDEIEANDIIGELSQEALLENGDWLLLHRSRPLEIPKG